MEVSLRLRWRGKGDENFVTVLGVPPKLFLVLLNLAAVDGATIVRIEKHDLISAVVAKMNMMVCDWNTVLDNWSRRLNCFLRDQQFLDFRFRNQIPSGNPRSARRLSLNAPDELPVNRTIVFSKSEQRSLIAEKINKFY